ncbi:winged helix-turn-helix domain-containing protein [Psychrosphaera haliotis]|uniref:winged helix-turn-helix domain-containing protein n=1 Tax=Psychrosphaera haliotis TaxID=555083 RepID=UPI0012DA269B|nr:winged helix-turn-helix domain-containing protein [Psychrosphaera haliotis]
MSKSINRCVIYPEKGQVELDDSLIVLRPKTFKLLLLLSEKPGEVFSKAQILDNIWSDKVVEDQAVFQSINEIRKEFGSNDIITTYPRRGYAWSCPNTSILDSNEVEKKAKPFSLFSSGDLFYKVIFSSLILLTILAVSIYLQASTSTSEKHKYTETVVATHDAILILPLEVENLHDSEKWVKFGAMQGLINKLIPTDNLTVFKLEDSIEILNRLSIEEKKDVSNIFKKSGASIVLKTSISGVPGDYNVIYSLFTSSTVETKTLHAKSINTAIDTLALIFNKTLLSDLNISEEFMNNKLQNDLLAKAIQFMAIDDYPSASTFLKSVITTDKTNIYAQYLLAKVAGTLGDLELALKSTEVALNLIKGGADPHYENRLLYIYGTLQLGKGNIELANQTLLKAKDASAVQKDWLYYSYSQSMLGKVNQFNGNYNKAESLFITALQYQEMLECPMGIAQSHLDMSELYLAQQQKNKAVVSFKIAEALINKQGLRKAEPILTDLRIKISQF